MNKIKALKALYNNNKSIVHFRRVLILLQVQKNESSYLKRKKTSNKVNLSINVRPENLPPGGHQILLFNQFH